MRKPCCDKQDTNKGAWSKQEDEKLVDYIAKHGEGCWRTLPRAAGLLRCGKSCRLRWINYLRPDLKRGNFADDEQDLIIKLHALLGNRWSLIAGRLPGRTDNEVKNYWNSHLRRKLINMGIDPNNHRLMTQTTSISRPQQNQHDHHSDSNATSSGSKHDIADHPINGPLMIVATTNNNDIVSDAGSCLDDHHHIDHGGLPDLNLDLSITISSSVGPIHSEKKDQKPNTSYTIDDHIDQYAPSPPLLLFR